MAELRTEEEQLDAIKRWWKENGTSLIVGVALTAAGIFGWNAWETHQENQAQTASLRYQQLTNLSAADELDEEALSEARRLVSEITDNHADTLYAEMALLLDANMAAQQGDLETTRTVLEQVIADSSRPYVKSLAWLRLARAELADGNPERALELLDEPISDSLAAQRANVRGDAYFALNREDDARNAWNEALNLAENQEQPLYGVQFKLDDLGTQETAL
ncbi:tetratricopeptide repeat protein [Vreelandella rituensis]|uniref:Ancillary SecYEG translocon subunit n=1 Tax=Vreelandella rituensis TaxID=2282306 RepID=A0A368U6A3_9GAMM|nr:tetratricopeptide repeat protein [Halomonas rituensis]RCV92525.1 hypothetical protein DU506_07415 [Halomonas rituensis]